jgi:hypothetical protein
MALAVTRANILAQPNRELLPRYQGMHFPDTPRLITGLSQVYAGL